MDVNSTIFKGIVVGEKKGGNKGTSWLSLRVRLQKSFSKKERALLQQRSFLQGSGRVTLVLLSRKTRLERFSRGAHLNF